MYVLRTCNSEFFKWRAPTHSHCTHTCIVCLLYLTSLQDGQVTHTHTCIYITDTTYTCTYIHTHSECLLYLTSLPRQSSHVHTYIYTYTHTYLHTHMQIVGASSIPQPWQGGQVIYIHTHTHTHIRSIHTFTQAHIHTYIHNMRTYTQWMPNLSNMPCKTAQPHTHTHMHIHTYIHNIYTYIYTYTQWMPNLSHMPCKTAQLGPWPKCA